MDELRALWPIFVAETREHLQLAGQLVLDLERPPGERPDGQLTQLQRALHTIKGSAGSMGFHQIELLAHRMEDSLASLPAEPTLGRDTVSVLLRGLELIEGMLNEVAEGRGEGTPKGLDDVLRALGGEVPSRAPSTADGPPDDSAVRARVLELWPVFRGDVAEGLTLLLDPRLDRPEPPDPVDLRGLVAVAESVERLGATLGLDGIKALGERARGILEGAWSARTGAELRRVVSQLERATAELDEHLEQLSNPQDAGPLTPVSSERTAPAGAVAGLELLTGLEAQLTAMLTPVAKARAAAHERLVQLAELLESAAAELPGVPAALRQEVLTSAKEAGAVGVAGAMATSALAGHLVELRAALTAPAPPPGPAMAPSAEEPLLLPQVGSVASLPKPRERRTTTTSLQADTGDSLIRVSRNAVEKLTDVLDRSALGLGRRERELKSLLDLYALSQDAAALATPQRGLGGSRAPDEGALESLRQRVRDVEVGLRQVTAAMTRDVEAERIVSAQLRGTVRELRTVPATNLADLLRRSARETAGRVGKNVRVEVRGEHLRLDRRIVDVMREPLLHLVRNAVDHGVEAPQSRLAKGKPGEGTITFSVELRGGRMLMELSDDGSGLDLARIREKAVERGLFERRELEGMSEAEVARVIFLPGFSTATQVTALSGRGVGLDVVESTVSSLGGTVSVSHAPGARTTFRIDLPRALGALLGLVLRVGPHRLVVPNDSVLRLRRVTRGELSVVAGRPMVRFGDHWLPFVSLARVLELTADRLPLESDEAIAVVGVVSDARIVAFAVDELSDQQELIVHPLGRHVKEAKHLLGAALLNDGVVVPVLQPGELIELAERQAEGSATEVPRPTVLVADDAFTTRAAIRQLLEIAGFRVLVASDGEEALRVLREQAVSLLITDLQMPRLDGAALTRRVKADTKLGHTPVLVITAQDSAEDRAAGLESGADGYLVKRDLEGGALVSRVRELIGEHP